MEKSEKYGVEPKAKVTEVTKTEVYDQVFTLVTRNKETEIAVGNHIVSRMKFNSVKDAKAYINKKPWDLIVNTTCCIYDMTNKVKS